MRGFRDPYTIQEKQYFDSENVPPLYERKVLNFNGLVTLGTRTKGESYTSEVLCKGLDEILRLYNCAYIYIKKYTATNNSRRFSRLRWNLGDWIQLFKSQEHVPHIEHENRVLQERFRVGLYILPFKVLPRTMIKYFTLRVIKNRSYFPKKTRIWSILSSYTILKCEQIDFNKEFLYSFGDYVQATEEKSSKKNNLPRIIDAICLRAAESPQEGHEMMDLATGRMFTRPQVKACTMTWMVVERV